MSIKPTHFLPYGRQTVTDSDIDAVVEVLRSSYLTQGPVVPKFENIVAACGDLSLNCIDTRNALDENDYFIHDNHLNKHGVKKVSQNYLYQ